MEDWIFDWMTECMIDWTPSKVWKYTWNQLHLSRRTAQKFQFKKCDREKERDSDSEKQTERGGRTHTRSVSTAATFFRFLRIAFRAAASCFFERLPRENLRLTFSRAFWWFYEGSARKILVPLVAARWIKASYAFPRSMYNAG